MRKYIIIPVIAVTLLQVSCKKAIDALIPDQPPQPPVEVAHTAIGTPIGNMSAKTIGTAGGSILSEDGRVELNFPAGALSANTDISIQPVTNEAPGGIGTSYHFMPDGSKFNQPVTLTFHYTDKNINGTNPFFLYVAFQDSTNAWKADFVKRRVDTVAKTVTLGISHFSIWSMGSRLILLANPDELHENQTSVLQILHIDIPSQTVSTAPGEDELATLPITSHIPDDAVTAWKVNGGPGNSADGTINGSGSDALYAAPSTIDEVKTVQVSAELNYPIVYFNDNKQIASVNKLILFADITLLPSELDFTVNVDYQQQPVQGMTYEDKATFDLTIKLQKDNNGSTTILLLGSNYQNYAPTSTPSTMHYSNGSSWTCLPGTIGLTNVIDVTLLSFTDSTANIRLEHGYVETWGVHAVDAKGEVGDVPIKQSPRGLPTDFTIALKDESQTIPDGLGGTLQLIPK